MTGCGRGGLRKDVARIAAWSKDIAPSADLRRWLSHEPEKWDLFRKRYFAKLDERSNTIGEIVKMASIGMITLVYGSKEQRYNNAVALKRYVEVRMAASGRKAPA